MTKTFNRHFIKGDRDLTWSTEAGDRRDASLTQPAPTAMGKPLLHERIQGRPRAYTPNMLVQGKKALYKVACAHAEGQRRAGPKDAATGEPAAGQPDDETATRRGPGPLE
jgi:hypothetical protein